MYSFNKSNSQNEQQILTKYFLLILENQRLHDQLSKIANKSSQEDNFVMQRINHIEKQMGIELKHKQIKIDELNQYIRQMHQQKQKLMAKFQVLQSKYRLLQTCYTKDKQEWYLTQSSIQKEIKSHDKSQQQHQYHVRLLERQKQQINQQLQRLKNVTFKQLESEIDILKKQNQTYISSINNYRMEQNIFKAQKIKYEQKIKKYCQQVNLNAMSKNQVQKQIASLHQQLNSYKKKHSDLESQYKKQVSQVNKRMQETIQKVEQKVKSKENQNTRLDSQLIRITEQSDKKSKKLREYDDQYTQYLVKMNSLCVENGHLKQEINKLKQKYEKLLIQQREKLKNCNKQTLQKAENEYRIQKQRYLYQLNDKAKQIQIKLRQEKIEQIKFLEVEIEQLKNQLDIGLRQQYQRCQKIEGQKNNAIKQWEQILCQMSTQKNIIVLLQKQIDQYRKSAKEAALHICQPQKQKQQQVQNIIDPIKQKDINMAEAENHRKVQKQIYAYQSIQQIQKQKEVIIHKESQRSQANLKYDIDSQKLKKQLQVLRQIRKSFGKSKKQQDQNNLCCIQCKSNELKHVQVNKVKKSCCDFTKKYETTQPQQSNQNFSTYQNIERLSMKRIDQESFLNRGLMRDNVGLLSYQSHQYERSLSSKRKDETSKKFQYLKTLRTKTQENFCEQSSKNIQNEKHFFNYKQSNYKQNQNRNLRTQISERQQNQRIVRSVKKQFSLAKEKDKTVESNEERKLIRSSSLRTVNYDKHLQEIQQYLSFELVPKPLQKSGSQHKLKSNDQINSQRMRTYIDNKEEGSQKAVLMQKINRINSWRDQVSMAKQAKSYNFCKRTLAQPPSRTTRVGDKKLEKENINQIIHRKCQYISEK